MVDEKDPQAVALGYVADASRVDAKKYPKYAAGQNCANCALYQGKPGRQGRPLPALRRQAGGRGRMVQRLGEEGLKAACRRRVGDVTLRGAGFRGNKAALPSKPCAGCGLPMSWRRRWAKNWADVRYLLRRLPAQEGVGWLRRAVRPSVAQPYRRARSRFAIAAFQARRRACLPLRQRSA